MFDNFHQGASFPGRTSALSLLSTMVKIFGDDVKDGMYTLTSNNCTEIDYDNTFNNLEYFSVCDLKIAWSLDQHYNEFVNILGSFGVHLI